MKDLRFKIILKIRLNININKLLFLILFDLYFIKNNNKYLNIFDQIKWSLDHIISLQQEKDPPN